MTQGAGVVFPGPVLIRGQHCFSSGKREKTQWEEILGSPELGQVSIDLKGISQSAADRGQNRSKKQKVRITVDKTPKSKDRTKGMDNKAIHTSLDFPGLEQPGKKISQSQSLYSLI